MVTAIDSAVLLDVLLDGPRHAPASIAALHRAAAYACFRVRSVRSIARVSHVALPPAPGRRRPPGAFGEFHSPTRTGRLALSVCLRASRRAGRDGRRVSQGALRRAG
jgi:hypothetical protein